MDDDYDIVIIGYILGGSSEESKKRKESHNPIPRLKILSKLAQKNKNKTKIFL